MKQQNVKGFGDHTPQFIKFKYCKKTKTVVYLNDYVKGLKDVKNCK